MRMEKLKPLNLYRSAGDREVWERAERDAKASGKSLSAYVVAVLRSAQNQEVASAE